jgi:hypothetical protein
VIAEKNAVDAGATWDTYASYDRGTREVRNRGDQGSRPLVRRGFGPGGGVAEVAAAGSRVLLRGYRRVAAGQGGVLVAVAAGEVDRETPTVRRSAVAQPEEWERGSIAQFAVDLDELSAVTDGQVGPAFTCAGDQPGAQRRLGRVGGVAGTKTIIAEVSACRHGGVPRVGAQLRYVFGSTADVAYSGRPRGR